MSDTTQRNKTIAQEAFEKVIVGRDAELAATYFREDYIQHNPFVGQGLAGVQDAVRVMADLSDPPQGEIQFMNAEDDTVWLYVKWSGGSFPGVPPLAYTAEIYRHDEDGMIAEHWDVLQFAQS